ncbi:MAG: 16S rRNA (guanine(966)-N(2))-methyltransferase RsmD [Candidatus Omnitrophota bacterium]
MQIITGFLKSRTIKIPKSKLIRPTSGKVRKAIFDILGDFIIKKNVLDLFSGSGALGLEALSSGAESVTFVEKNQFFVKVIKENAKNLVLGKNTQVFGCDVFEALNILARKKISFEIIFIDPPYYRDLAKKCLLEISKYDIVHPLGIVVAEHHKKDELPENCNSLTRWKYKKYGDTFVSFYSYS